MGFLLEVRRGRVKWLCDDWSSVLSWSFRSHCIHRLQKLNNRFMTGFSCQLLKTFFNTCVQFDAEWFWNWILGFPPRPIAWNSGPFTSFSAICKEEMIGWCMLNCTLINCPVQRMHRWPEFKSNIEFYDIEYYSVFLLSQFSFVGFFIKMFFAYLLFD